MKLVGRVPVEPLDDERLTNIERRLVVRVAEMSQRPVRAPRRTLAFAGVAVAMALACFVGYQLRDGGSPVVAAQSERFAMTAGALDLGDAQIAGADFTVERSDDRVVVTMQPGTIDLHVEHKPGRLFVVKAGGVEIEDVGTRFSVDWRGANVDVRVTEGEVKVKHAGKEFAVKAGNAWTVEIGPITIAALERKHAITPATKLDETTAAAPATEQVAAHVEAGSGSTGNGSTRSGSAGSGSAGSGGTGSGGGPGSGARHKAGKTDARKALDKAGYEPPLPTAATTPSDALADYSQKASVTGHDTTRLLYSMAVVQHRAKNDDGALRTLKGVTKRVGADAYQDGMWLVVRITCLNAFDDACRLAAERYRLKFPAGTRTGIVDAILSEISQQ